MSNPNERTRRSRSHNAIDRLRRRVVSCQLSAISSATLPTDRIMSSHYLLLGPFEDLKKPHGEFLTIRNIFEAAASAAGILVIGYTLLVLVFCL